VAVLRTLGGYTSVIEDAIEKGLARIEGNPRAAHDLPVLRPALRARVPDMRQRVQAIIARTSLAPRRAPTGNNTGGDKRGRLRSGSHPEVWLRAADLRFTGRVDLLTVADGSCTITDYKTGAPGTHHIDQVKNYALLWMRDHDLNPDFVPVRRLVLSYASHDEVADGPSHPEVDALANQLSLRVVAAERELERRPPPARPSPALCSFCSVRHLCEDYWNSSATIEMRTPGTLRSGSFLDCAGIVAAQNGARSWVLEMEPNRTSLLLRTATEEPGFRVGDHVRLLSVIVDRDDDTGAVSLGSTHVSEVFVLAE